MFKKKSKTTKQKTLAQIQNERGRNIKQADTKVPWTPVPALRELMMKLNKLERRYERLCKTAEKRIDHYIDKKFPEPKGADKEMLKNRKTFIEKLKRRMLDRADSVRRAKMIKRAEKVQAKIDEIVAQPMNGLRRAA